MRFIGLSTGCLIGVLLFSRTTTAGQVTSTRRLPAPAARVLAFYYGWYGTPQVSRSYSHYEGVNTPGKKISSQPHYPTNGPYDSADSAVLQRHIDQTAANGIQTLVCSWWGKGDQTDRSFRAMLPLAAAKNITLCPLIEATSRTSDPTAVLADWRYLLKEYGNSPGWLKVEGKPVFFLFGRAQEGLQPEEWATTLATLEKDFPPGVVVIGEGDRYETALTFDGLYHFNQEFMYRDRPLAQVPANFQAGFRRLRERCQRYGRIPVITVGPGGDGYSQIRGPVLVEPSKDLSYYKAQWEEALKVKNAWVLVNSFNQWHAGTEIEPSVEYGDAALKLTHDYSLRFRGVAGM